jgi:hypothetical protein
VPGPMPFVPSALKNECTKRALRLIGSRKAPPDPPRTAHYRMPLLESRGGRLALRAYDGPEIPAEQWQRLEYTAYAPAPGTHIAPITSPTGLVDLVGADEADKQDLDCAWTTNATKCPAIVAWLASVGAPFGKVQLLRTAPNTLREARWGLHRDDNNTANPQRNGWVVRVWLELTDDGSSVLLVRRSEFDRSSEVPIPLPKYRQAVVDSEALWHGVYHRGPAPRYAVVASFESCPALEEWLLAQLP